MSLINASCETCGDDVQLTENDVTVVHEVGQDRYFYRFKCPEGFINLNEVPTKSIDPLLNTEVKVIEINVPVERIKEALPDEHYVRYPISEAEQVEFHLELVKNDPIDLIRSFEAGE